MRGHCSRRTLNRGTRIGHGRQTMLNRRHDFGARALRSAGIKRRCGSVFERQLHRFGVVDPGDFGHERQGHVDTRGDTPAGNHVPVAYDPRGIEAQILPTCRELGIDITAYGVLSRGLISGHWDPAVVAGGKDIRPFNPRFQGANLATNLALVEKLRRVAASIGASVAQVAIAWVAAQGEDIIPLIGTKRRDRLKEALGALSVELSAEQLAALTAAVPANAVAGGRYPAASVPRCQ